jgi:hypothetical protein
LRIDAASALSIDSGAARRLLLSLAVAVLLLVVLVEVLPLLQGSGPPNLTG